MNLYLDTSALVKLYVAEKGSSTVHAALQQATVAATSTLAYVEARSALARRRREDGLAVTEYRRAVRSLDADWGALPAVEAPSGHSEEKFVDSGLRDHLAPPLLVLVGGNRVGLRLNRDTFVLS